MQTFSRFLLPCLLAAISSLSMAWHDTGHMVVAEIASKRLSTKARQEIDRLLKIGGTEKTNELVTAPCWADDFKTRENGLWHYINYHFRTDGKPTSMKPEEKNIVWAIRKFDAVLKDTKAPDSERAEALRYLLHFVGDIHMPLHTVARDTDAFPDGDRGGSEFKLLSPNGMKPAPRNLHFLWDMGAGNFIQVERPLSPEGRVTIAEIAREAMRQNPTPLLEKQIKVSDPEAWALEGFEFSKAKVYGLNENEEPNAEYLAMVRKESLRLVALAGYRLGNLLNELLAN